MPSLDHPYCDLSHGQWLAGTLHAHGPRTGGHRASQAILDDYAARGYGFVMIAEHDVYTTAGDYAALDAKGMVLIPGSELTKAGPHLMHVGADEAIDSGEPGADVQRVFDEAARQQSGGFIVGAHPNFGGHFDHIPFESFMKWRGCAGLEIYNGLIHRTEGSAMATDKWDRLLSAGKRLWGFADDDSFTEPDVQQGWNIAWVRERSVPGVLEALRSGQFYASSGVKIEAIEVEGLHVRVRAAGAERIIGITRGGKRFVQTDGDSIEATVPGDMPYARFECVGRNEARAWTQPFWVKA